MTADGSVVVTCGSCGTKLRTRATADGRTAKCPKCGTTLRIEIPTAAAPGSATTPATVRAPEALAEAPAPIPESAPAAPAPVEPAPATSAPATSASSEAGPVTSAPNGAANVMKAIILALAAIIIGAFAWYLSAAFIPARLWVVKFSVVAVLIGLTAAAVVAGATRRRTEGVKIASVLAAMFSILLGKVLVVLLLEAAPRDARHWIAMVIEKGFTAVDPLFFAMSALGCALRFILWK